MSTNFTSRFMSTLCGIFKPKINDKDYSLDNNYKSPFEEDHSNSQNHDRLDNL